MTKRAMALAALLLAGCTVQVGPGGGGTPAPGGSVKPGGTTAPAGSPPPLADDAVILRFDSSGGFCPAPGCGVEMTIRADGSYEGQDQRYGALAGRFEAAKIAELRGAIARADFKALRAVDRKTPCTRIADDATVTFAFPSQAGAGSFTSCSTSFDEPPFRLGQALVYSAVEAAAAKPSPSPSPSSSPSAAPSGDPGDAVVTVAAYGGNCPDFPCGSETTYQRDGRYKTTKGAKELGAGKVPSGLVAAVAAEIAKADFAAFRAKPFTGTCPTAYDGAEVTYTFRRDGKDEQLGACTYDLPLEHPLFKATQALEQARLNTP